MDTIFAPATPPGRSGVAVLRLSGPLATRALSSLGCACPSPRVATLATLRLDESGDILDRGLVLYFPAPHSFTGEDVVELHLHGSRAVMEELLLHLGAQDGLRLAEAGEFSRRAFFNNKFDLTQAEALADLIDADTSAQRRQALRQMDGALGAVSAELRRGIIEARAHLEAYLDFPDEEIPASVAEKMDDELRGLLTHVRDLLHENRNGEKIRDGFYVVILGRPNAGKSTLLNALARRDVAIVSPEAGTTRDVIECPLALEGFSITLADTAGLRNTMESVEAEGIRRAMQRADKADFRLVLLDASLPRAVQEDVLCHLKPDDVVVLNKSDIKTPYIDEYADLPSPIRLSALSGNGLEHLILALKERMQVHLSTGSDAVITRARHRTAFAHVERYLVDALNESVWELKSEALRLASVECGKITGAIHIEEVLDRVFSSFCIGK